MADTEEDFGDIVVRQSADGGIVRVRDVARVVDGFEDEEILATLNGEPAVLLQAMTTDNMQVTRSSDAVRARGSTSARRRCRRAWTSTSGSTRRTSSTAA